MFSNLSTSCCSLENFTGAEMKHDCVLSLWTGCSHALAPLKCSCARVWSRLWWACPIPESSPRCTRHPVLHCSCLCSQRAAGNTKLCLFSHCHSYCHIAQTWKCLISLFVSTISPQHLVSPGVCVRALAPVDGLSDALIGTDDGRLLFVW